jgi:hypothetical protein
MLSLLPHIISYIASFSAALCLTKHSKQCLEGDEELEEKQRGNTNLILNLLP